MSWVCKMCETVNADDVLECEVCNAVSPHLSRFDYDEIPDVPTTIRWQTEDCDCVKLSYRDHITDVTHQNSARILVKGNAEVSFILKNDVAEREYTFYIGGHSTSATSPSDTSKRGDHGMTNDSDSESEDWKRAKPQELAAKEQTEKLRSSKIFWHVPYIMVIIFIGILYSNMENKRNILQHTVDTLESQNRTMSSVLRKLSSFNTPLFIGDISIRNDGGFYGSTIYSKNTIFIIPKVEIFSLIDGWTDIYIRLYTPDGLSKGGSSPIGYTYHDEFNMEKNTTNICEFSGWRRKNSENWRPGSYRFEFYYQNKCIGSKNFTIY